ncbi:MAG: DUF975 family protein [Pseudoflavonifractor sp.]|nr:DUF975 family protein [Pseudoflavonifractor sp.]
MGFNRFEAKMAAKNSMRGTRPNPLWVTLVFILLTTAVDGVVLRIVGDPFMDAAQYLAWGYSGKEVLQYVFLRDMGGVGFFLSVQTMLSLYGAIMGFGYTSYSLRLARGEQPSYRNLFDGFAKAGRVLWMNILTWVFIFLWEMLAVIPGAVLLAVAAFQESEILISLSIMLYVAGVIVGVMASYRYRLAPYFLLDDPGCTARQAISRSKVAMQGWKMELFSLDLSFFGWILLGAFTMGILYIWVNPYMAATQANFYDYISAGSGRQSGGYAGPDYGDGRFSDGPRPF